MHELPDTLSAEHALRGKNAFKKDTPDETDDSVMYLLAVATHANAEELLNDRGRGPQDFRDLSGQKHAEATAATIRTMREQMEEDRQRYLKEQLLVHAFLNNTKDEK